MIKSDVVVVGGSAAGLTAAITARRHNPKKEVLLLRKEKQVMIPCGIPYIFGTVEKPENNLIPDAVCEKNNIKIVIGELASIDRAKKTLKTKDGEEISYDKLILGLGSNPLVPPIPGVEKENVFAIQKDVPYIQSVLDKLDASDCKNLVIVGCGFIGIEFAEECQKRKKDLNIKIVEMLKNCLQLVFDEEFCVKCEEILKEKGIEVMLDEKVQSIGGNKKVESISLASGKKIDADIVILGIGAKANSEIGKEAGLEIGPTGGFAVNRYMQTSDDSIFACGDCAEKVSFFDGKSTGLKLASIAAMEARVAGANLFAPSRANMGVIGIFSTILGDISFAGAGMTETSARENGYAIIVGESEAINTHPGGMPGSANLKVKLIFEAGTHVLIGGQVIGARSGGELINAISACLHQRMTADDIATFQMGTHPALTASPIAYQLVNAADIAIAKLKNV